MILIRCAEAIDLISRRTLRTAACRAESGAPGSGWSTIPWFAFGRSSCLIIQSLEGMDLADRLRDQILGTAKDLKYTREILPLLTAEWTDPSEAFVRRHDSDRIVLPERATCTVS